MARSHASFVSAVRIVLYVWRVLWLQMVHLRLQAVHEDHFLICGRLAIRWSPCGQCVISTWVRPFRRLLANIGFRGLLGPCLCTHVVILMCYCCLPRAVFVQENQVLYVGHVGCLRVLRLPMHHLKLHVLDWLCNQILPEGPWRLCLVLHEEVCCIQ